MAGPRQTLYDILGVARDADGVAITLAHDQRRAELQRSGQDPGALALLHEAYEVLGDPVRRAAYDASLLSAEEKAAAREQAPDLVLEPEPPTARRRIPPVGIAAGIFVVAIAVFLALHRPKPAAPPAPPPAAVAPVPPPPPAPRTKGAAEILAAALPAVGRVQSFETSGRAVPVGLAVSLEPGTMVTTCHAIPPAAQLVVSVDGLERSARLEVADEVLDLCRLAVPGLDAKPLALAGTPPAAGQRIYAMGANAAGDFALTEGTVRQKLADARGELLEISMPVAPLGSGGPVFDELGRVVGLASTTRSHGAGIGVALPAAWIARMRSREAGAAPGR